MVLKDMALAYIALGSNVSYAGRTPAETLPAAFAALAELGSLMAYSSLYQTEPVGYTSQPPFVNAVVALETVLAPAVLLDGLLTIEQRFGRDRSDKQKNGPRTLDLDLLLLDQNILQTERLTLPHPRLAERRFVLAPLAEIAAGLRHPDAGVTMQQLLDQLPQHGEHGPDTVRKLR